MTRIKPVLQALLTGAVVSVLSWTVMAQEPLGKAGEPQKITALPKKSSPRRPPRWT